ncbi:protein of unknown function [Jannaschia faecimaris]|uniref:DUF3859 domain-containing protein n=1 Tax=Jannaschia faecimaris TaxID=1244108 RepID=A0A1H3TZY9_9RHOB|nr:DUF3859 domain-containing protein [Jannaschia faecimaris]SDZ55816.1 protein of unknown function [Jannaschia faecimaris]
MHLTALLTALFLASPLLASPASAQVRLVDAGIICPRESEGEFVDAPGTESGFIRRIRQGLAFDLPDRTVPTMDQLSFGFRTTLKAGAATTPVTVVVTHPPMGERGIEREEWTDVMTPDASNLNLFTFEMDYEKVPGPWTFSIEIDGQPIVTVPFEVTETENQGRVERACFQFMS